MAEYTDFLDCGDRVYYFSIEKTVKNRPFLKISCRRMNSSNKVSICVFENEIEAFASGLMRTLVKYPYTKVSPLAPNRFKAWTKEEDYLLEINFATGVSIDDLMDMLGRTEVGIQKRIDKLRLEDKYIV